MVVHQPRCTYLDKRTPAARIGSLSLNFSLGRHLWKIRSSQTLGVRASLDCVLDQNIWMGNGGLLLRGHAAW